MQATSDATNWFIKAGGSLKGPYPSRDAASQAMLNEGIQGVIIPGTPDGKEILLG